MANVNVGWRTRRLDDPDGERGADARAVTPGALTSVRVRREIQRDLQRSRRVCEPEESVLLVNTAVSSGERDYVMHDGW